MGSTSLNSMTFFNVTAAGYFAALFTYLVSVVNRRRGWRTAAIVLAAGGFLAQASGLALRWYESGLVEVAAWERAEGTVLHGAHWFAVFAQHPPWSNLYEIMVFMSYGLVLVLLVLEVRFRIQLVGLFGLVMALTALAIASLSLDPTIKPLVPALQSWWIMIHVISSVVGYSAGSLAAVVALLFLVKDRVAVQKMAMGTLGVALGILFVQGRGFLLLTTGEYRARLMRDVGTEFVGVVRKTATGEFKPFHAAVPGVGPLMLLGMLLSIAGIVVLYRSRNQVAEALTGAGKALYLAVTATYAAIIGAIIYASTSGNPVAVDAAASANLMPPPPWRFHLSGNQWDLALLFIVFLGLAFVAVAVTRPQLVRNLLPDAKKLDQTVHNAIMVAFLLVGVVLVTGALWAHYAWGRYWGWDPKETGALVIWFVYAVYLHARITLGWVGRPSAVVAVLAFFVILAGFLGVNLGWFADGLHSYGAA